MGISSFFYVVFVTLAVLLITAQHISFFQSICLVCAVVLAMLWRSGYLAFIAEAMNDFANTYNSAYVDIDNGDEDENENGNGNGNGNEKENADVDVNKKYE